MTRRFWVYEVAEPLLIGIAGVLPWLTHMHRERDLALGAVCMLISCERLYRAFRVLRAERIILRKYVKK